MTDQATVKTSILDTAIKYYGVKAASSPAVRALEHEVLKTSRQYYNCGSTDNYNHWRRAVRDWIRADNAEHDRLEKLPEAARTT